MGALELAEAASLWFMETESENPGAQATPALPSRARAWGAAQHPLEVSCGHGHGAPAEAEGPR